MIGHIRTVSEKAELRDVSGKSSFGPGSRRLALATAALFALLAPVLLVAEPVQAQQTLVNFEDYTGPGEVREVDPPLTIREATFSGGGIATNVARVRNYNNSTIYGTWHNCEGCSKTITVAFSKPVSDVSFFLMNARLDTQTFKVTDSTGKVTEVKLQGYLFAGSRAVVTLPSTEIDSITSFTIQQTTSPSSGYRRFFMDDLRYTVDEPKYTVSFSAFVPHDNVVAAPTAHCLYNENWNPDNLGQQGGAPANGRSFPINSGTAASETDGNRRQLFFAGDNRNFEPGAPTYRLRQAVKVIPNADVDSDGVEEGSVENLAGDELAFAEDAMEDGVIDTGDDDEVSDDCRLFHQAYRADTDRMNVEVTRNGPKTVQIRFSGSLDSPLMGPAEAMGQIDWDFTLTLDTSEKPGGWVLTGAHDGFPAYEIYINKTPIYQHDPGQAPYDFASQVRKLLPPLDVEFAQTSGDLP